MTSQPRTGTAACRRDHSGAWRVLARHDRYSQVRCGACGRTWRSNGAYVAQLPDEDPAETETRARRIALLSPKLRSTDRQITAASLVLRGDALRPLAQSPRCDLCLQPLTDGLAIPAMSGTDEVILHDGCAADVRACQLRSTGKLLQTWRPPARPASSRSRGAWVTQRPATGDEIATAAAGRTAGQFWLGPDGVPYHAPAARRAGDQLARVVCPDGGTCHHECTGTVCFRVVGAGPLAGRYPRNQWPAEVRRRCGQPAGKGA